MPPNICQLPYVPYKLQTQNLVSWSLKLSKPLKRVGEFCKTLKTGGILRETGCDERLRENSRILPARFQSESKCEAFHVEISFIHTQILLHLHVNKTNFHMKGFALGLTLKQKQKATCKCVILVHCSSYCTSTGGGGALP